MSSITMSALSRCAVLSGLATSLYLSMVSPASAAAILHSRDPASSANDWDPVLNGDSGAECADLAVIFARGTFDDGQGALCAHKSLGELGNAAGSVIALGVFGDPVGIWQDTVDYPAVPSSTKLLSYCEKTTPDPLCTSVTEDFPKDPIGFINRLVDMFKQADTTHMNDTQKKALASLITELPKQAKDQLSQLAKDIVSGHLRRWMLTPQHFWYGNDGTVNTAVSDLIGVYQGKK